MYYGYKVGPSWFLSLCEAAWVSRGLPAILAFGVCVVLAHLFSLYCDCVFACGYLGWIGILSWETSQYLPCVVVTLGMACLL